MAKIRAKSEMALPFLLSLPEVVNNLKYLGVKMIKSSRSLPRILRKSYFDFFTIPITFGIDRATGMDSLSLRLAG